MDSFDLNLPDKSKPDLLRVGEYVLGKSSQKESFSVTEAASTSELNGINSYRIAEILREVCLQPNGPESINRLTDPVDNRWSDSGAWTLNAEAYFGYLSYQSNKNAEKANLNAKRALVIAAATLIVTLIIHFLS